MRRSDHSDAWIRRPRTATTAVFFVHGLLFASWTAHIPLVQSRLGLDYGTLGLALLGAPVGSVSSSVVVGHLLPRLGSRRLVQVCLGGYCVLGALVGQAGSFGALFASLFLWGAFLGSLDVSMNTQAVTVERREERPVMSGLHAGWSIGSFVGAGAGTLGVALSLSLTAQLLTLGLPALAVTWALSRQMATDAISEGTDGHPTPAGRPRRLSRPVLVLGTIAFASMLCEGATADWASVYLRGALRTSTTVAGLGYAAFSLAMVIIRLGGNRLLRRFRADRLLPALAGVATVGMAASLVVGMPVAALLGFAALGIGLASVVPAVFSAAGRLPDVHAGTALATVAACGWAGFVCGPPLIGQAATVFSLPVALGLIPLLTLFVMVATARSRTLEGARSGTNLGGGVRSSRARPGPETEEIR